MDWSFRTSLRYYVGQMEKGFHTAPGFQSGLRAYDVWARALEGGNFHPFGLRYITAVYAEAKMHAANYLEMLAHDWGGLTSLGEAAPIFKDVAAVFQNMTVVLEQDVRGAKHLGEPATAKQAAALAPLVRQARRLEVDAITLV